ncbi:MAG: endo-1,4-beta-xylanase, partial [Methanomassiliicoccales archaeon]
MVTATPKVPTLRELADNLGFKIGAQGIWQGLVDTRISKRYTTVLSREFNVLLISDFEWQHGDGSKGLRPAPDEFDFEYADIMVNFAMRNDMQVFGQHLIWGYYPFMPDWLTKINHSRDELKSILQNHIKTVMQRYRGKVTYWSVVNEPYPYSKGGEFWYDQLGQVYIDLAFETARRTDPQAVLILNDCCNEVVGQRSNFDLETAKRLKETTIEIDGRSYSLIDAVGMQMHLDGAHPPTKEDVLANMKRFGDIGVDIYITEFDVDLTNVPGTEAEKYERQAQVYKDMLTACLASEVCKGFIMFGFTDKVSWYEFTGKPDANALPFDDDF